MRLIFILIGQSARKYVWQWAALGMLLLLLSAFWTAEPIYSSYAVDELLSIASGGEVDIPGIFTVWGLLFAGLSLIQAIAKYFQWKLTTQMELDLAQRMYRHVLHLPVQFHVRQKSGEAVKIIDEGAVELSYITRILLDLLPSIVTSSAFLVVSFLIEPILAAVLIGSLLLFILVIIFGTLRTAKMQDRANKAWVKPSGRAFDAMTNIFAVKSAAREDEEVRRMQAGHRQVMRWQLKVNLRWALIEGMNFFMLTRILLIGIGILLLARGILTLGQVYFFQLSFFRVLVPFEILASALPQWNKSVGKIRLANGLFDFVQEDHARQHSVRLPELKGAIEFHDVSFGYDRDDMQPLIADDDDDDARTDIFLEDRLPETEEDGTLRTTPPEERREMTEPEDQAKEQTLEPISVLHHIDLTVRAGEHVALVGHSGAGKSTIAMLLNRFYDPTDGTIFIDGTDLRDIDLKWWRSKIGLVLQDNLMFNDTLFENIRYARPSATQQEIVEAAKRASAHEFIEKLPDSYQTEVGERGIRLSGGERQRIAIARAILKDPAIVILDEATSALDSLTERKVQEGIKELIQGRTSFIIAHRLSTVRTVDRIAIVEGGRIAACAPHDELLRISPVYSEMVDLQKGGVLAE